MIELRFPTSGSLYLRESRGSADEYVTLDRDVDPSGQFCIGPSCERGWYVQGPAAPLQSRFQRGQCKLVRQPRFLSLSRLNRAKFIILWRCSHRTGGSAH